MCMFSKKLVFALILSSLQFSSSRTFNLGKLKLLDNNDTDISTSTTSDYDYGNYGSFEVEHDHSDGGHEFR